MPSSPVGGSSPQRPGASWHEPGHASPRAGTSQGPQAPTGLLSRSRREPDPALSTRRRLQAQVKAHAGEVERLTSFQQDVIAQAGRVQQRLNLAREELATRQEAPEVQPAGLRQAEEQVSLLAWRHRNMGERRQQAAQMLRDAEEHLAMAQEQLSALGTPSPRSPSTPALTPPDSPTAPMPGSPARPVVSPPRTGPSTSEAIPAGSPADPRQEHVARLRRQADNLDRTITALETRLQDAEAARLDVGPLLAEAKKKFDASEERISNALTEKGRGGQAHLDKENGRAYVEKVQLEERKKQLGRTQEALHALLAPARKDLLDIQRQLAEADARPPPGTNLRSLSNTSSARQAAADMELLVDALGGEGAAVERLVERAGRRTPHTLAGWLRRPFSKGAPKPLKGKRQDAFMQLVHSDVMKVARHGEIPPLQAADLVLEGVESTALGADLAPQDREHLLASLRQLREELADPQARQPQPGQGTQGMLRTA